MVILCGTIDKVFKDADGKLCICDYKFTTTWDTETYLEHARHLPALRFYSMMLRDFLELDYYPPVYLEGIFLKRLSKSKPDINKIAEFKVSSRYEFFEEEMTIFKNMLDETMKKWIGYLNQADYKDRSTWPLDRDWET